MSSAGDNDDMWIMLMDGPNMANGIEWKDARDRLAAFLMSGPTANESWAINHAEDLLCAAFTGAAACSQERER